MVKEDPDSVAESVSEENRIVILIEDEEEELTPPTVTLLEEEEREEEEERHEEEAWEKENIFYCGHLNTLSCLASLHEHLRLYCSAALALQRLRRERNAQTSKHTQTHSTGPDPTSTQASASTSEKISKTEWPAQAPHDEKIAPTDTIPAPAHIPEPIVELSPDVILLEPSRTSPISTHSFSDTSLSGTIPTKDVSETPPLTGDLQDSKPQYLDQIPESTSSSSLSPSSFSMLTPTSEFLSLITDKVGVTVPTKEQPLPTPTRPVEIPPPTELLTPGPEAVEPNRFAAFEDLQHKTETVEVPPLTPQEEEVEDILLSVPVSQSGAQRTATDFYAEPQNLSELSHGNGNQVHGSNQKESVFMRLNNRIKALEMNMSLSSRYLEELSQR